MANYPGASVSFATKVNLQDAVDANDINLVYEEVAAIANTVGLNPQARSTAWGIGSFSSAATSLVTVGQRIKNVEDGVFTVINDFVRLAGGSVILPTATTTVNLALRSAVSQTANLFEARNSGGVAVAAITPAGALRALSLDGGSA